MVPFLMFILFLATVNCHDQKSYDGWSLHKIQPKTNGHLDYLNSLHKHMNGQEFQIWQHGSLKVPFNVLLSPKARDASLLQLDELGIMHSMSVQNIQDALDAEKVPVVRHSHPRLLNNLKNSDWFTKFLTFDEINVFLQQLAKDNPEIVTLETIGKTHEGRPITVVKVSSKSGQDKPSIWIDGGIHAREWISTSTVLYMLNQLVTNSTIRNYVDGATWYMVPVLNPDGYAYTHTSNENRYWRKNRGPSSSFRSDCVGVDVNRNFDFAFGTGMASSDPCDDVYTGPNAFSELESQAVRDFVLSHKDIKAFITLHTFAQMWFYPYSDRDSHFSPDVQELKEIAQKGAEAIESVYGTEYRVDTAADILYATGGGSHDWAKAKGEVKFAYALELRQSPGGFVVSPREIVPTGEETWAGMRVVADAVMKEK